MSLDRAAIAARLKDEAATVWDGSDLRRFTGFLDRCVGRRSRVRAPRPMPQLTLPLEMKGRP